MELVEYLNSIKKQLEYYKSIGEKTLDQLNGQELFWQFNDESNSVAIIVNHLWGNMKSRWTDFLLSDGEKEWRNRDLEFELVITSKEELLNKWDEGWSCFFAALDSINEENINTEIYIRDQAHSVMEAVHRQFAHYSYHIGQMVYVGRMVKGSKWENLTIPKGKSSDFNKEKFSKGKHAGDFSDGLK
ncbi:DUF1572 family protein [Marivirga sp. S37H4]|uniref:DUF1572 family protein n=1 Tax=Marivirga aurantiaca TaxID=2802615 RepID=A0A934WZM3_9BACT|nr:DUF1572 family protein [Marivirga aurantiaca]MBK6266148.1 DUF1572 family protein [Marivirga aurantiaca]